MGKPVQACAFLLFPCESGDRAGCVQGATAPTTGRARTAANRWHCGDGTAGMGLARLHCPTAFISFYLVWIKLLCTTGLDSCFSKVTPHTLLRFIWFSEWLHLKSFTYCYPCCSHGVQVLTVPFSISITSLHFSNLVPTKSLKDNKCFQRIWTAVCNKAVELRIWVPVSWWITLVACRKQVRDRTNQVLRFIWAGLLHCFVYRVADPLLYNFIMTSCCQTQCNENN